MIGKFTTPSSRACALCCGTFCVVLVLVSIGAGCMIASYSARTLTLTSQCTVTSVSVEIAPGVRGAAIVCDQATGATSYMFDTTAHPVGSNLTLFRAPAPGSILLPVCTDLEHTFASDQVAWWTDAPAGVLCFGAQAMVLYFVGLAFFCTSILVAAASCCGILCLSAYE